MGLVQCPIAHRCLASQCSHKEPHQDDIALCNSRCFMAEKEGNIIRCVPVKEDHENKHKRGADKDGDM